jgi:hypothetical protein
MIAALFVLPFSSQALDATITKIVNNNGFLEGVLITTKDAVIRVNVYGIIEKVTPNNPKVDQENALREALNKPPMPYPNKLELKYNPVSAMDGNGGKITAINGITVAYYPCTAANQTFNSVQYYGQNMSPSPNSNNASPLTVNPRYRNACPNVSANGGKVQSIGDLTFGYYPDTSTDSDSGKLQRVGNIIISYTPQNSFSNQGGQLQTFGQ